MGSRLRSTCVRTAVLGACVLVPASAGLARAASPPNYTYAVTAHDLALAGQVASVKGDLPALRWRGGAVKPDRSPDTTTCQGQPRPDLAGLTVTGDAATRYQAPGTFVYVQVQLFREPGMTELDWERNHPRSAALACYAREVAKTLHEPGARVLRRALLPLPPIAEHEYGARAVVSFRGAAHPVLFDQIEVSSGRVEYTVAIVSADTNRLDESAAASVELRLALGLEARTLDRVQIVPRQVPSVRLDGTHPTVVRTVAVYHSFGLGQTWRRTWRFQPHCSAGSCTTTLLRPSLAGTTTYHETLVPLTATSYGGRDAVRGACTIQYADGHTSVLPDATVNRVFLVVRATSVAAGAATAYTGTLMIEEIPLAAARAHGCREVNYQLNVFASPA